MERDVAHIGRRTRVLWPSHWPHILRRGSAADRLLGLRVRIPPRHGTVHCTVHWLRADALNQCTGPTFTESEDTRCCVNTIFPPEDGHVNARFMSRIIV